MTGLRAKRQLSVLLIIAGAAFVAARPASGQG
jgi:hypothetical protein